MDALLEAPEGERGGEGPPPEASLEFSPEFSPEVCRGVSPQWSGDGNGPAGASEEWDPAEFRWFFEDNLENLPPVEAWRKSAGVRRRSGQGSAVPRAAASASAA